MDGFKIELDTGRYYALPIAPLSMHTCFEQPFQYALRSLAKETYPEAEYRPDSTPPCVYYRQPSRFGFDCLRFSRQMNPSHPPKWAIFEIRRELEEIHRLSEDPDIPQDRREFFRNLTLPDPRRMPECWRLVGWFPARLCILWGIGSSGHQKMFLPQTSVSEHWQDAALRTPIADTFGVPAEPIPSAGRIRARRMFGCFWNLLGWLVFFFLAFLIFNALVPGCNGCRGIRTKHPNMHRQPLQGNRDTPKDSQTSDIEGRERRKTPMDDIRHDEAQRKEEEARQRDDMQRRQEDAGRKSDVQREDDIRQKKEAEASEKRPLPYVPPKAYGYARYRFRVNLQKNTAQSSKGLCDVSFTVSPFGSQSERPDRWTVRNWRINDVIRSEGKGADIFEPEGGLSVAKTYTITADVYIGELKQEVEPFRWNAVDAPTWQIMDVGKTADSQGRRYKLICYNSSMIDPEVTAWNVAFSADGADFSKTLASIEMKAPVVLKDEDTCEVRKDIRSYEGLYFQKITAQFSYIGLDGEKCEGDYSEVFPYCHSSSEEDLRVAKYRTATPGIFFCLSTLTSGEQINGTAFAVSDKYLLTNYHVAVGGVPEAEVEHNEYTVAGPVSLSNMYGECYWAKVVDKNRRQDIALLRLCNQDGSETDAFLPRYLHLASDALLQRITSETPRRVFAVGYPQGTVCMGPPAYTEGKAEEILPVNGNPAILHYSDIKKGYSGGPLIDSETGAVLGINFGGLLKKEGGQKPASLATVASEARKILPKAQTR